MNGVLVATFARSELADPVDAALRLDRTVVPAAVDRFSVRSFQERPAA